MLVHTRSLRSKYNLVVDAPIRIQPKYALGSTNRRCDAINAA
jgi:hypothetical protein